MIVIPDTARQYTDPVRIHHGSRQSGTPEVRGSLHPEVTEDLAGRPLPLVGTALHVPLEVDRAVLAGEVQVALAHALVAGVPVAVTGRPVRVRPVAVRVRRPRRQRGPAVPLAREPRQHG